VWERDTRYFKNSWKSTNIIHIKDFQVLTGSMSSEDIRNSGYPIGNPAILSKKL
jgi:hypothetical protein